MAALVVPHDPHWKLAFEDEAEAIKDAFGSTRIRLRHIGSTAIPGILAKPIIDILGVVAAFSAVDANTQVFEGLGYQAMGSYGIEGRRYFRKFDGDGIRTHHLHIFEKGSPHVERHMAFRDYLIAHPEVAEAYSALKKSLTSSDAPSWEAYIEGKDPFVRRVEAEAVDWFRKLPR